MKKAAVKIRPEIGLATGLALSIVACSGDGIRNRYVLAERFWSDGKYGASVAEFEKVARRDPRGALGHRALFRAAMTQSLYLSEYGEALKKFRQFVTDSNDADLVYEAQRQIGEIYYHKLEQYDRAAIHYRALARAKPADPEAAEFLYYAAKSHFFLSQFGDAVATFGEIFRKYKASPYAERALLEIGVTHYTRGEQTPGVRGAGTEVYQDALDAYQNFLKQYPNSRLAPEARFGIAACLEELDQLDAAYKQYEAIRATYPSKNVIEIKLARLKERMAQRSR